MFLRLATIGAIVASLCFADTLTLRSGRVITGQYLGGDARHIRMAIGDRVDTFNVEDVGGPGVRWNPPPPPPAPTDRGYRAPVPPPPVPQQDTGFAQQPPPAFRSHARVRHPNSQWHAYYRSHDRCRGF